MTKVPSTMHRFDMPKVYSYTRWSTPEQAKGDSARRQGAAADAWAAARGMVLDTSLSINDAGVSAYRGSNAGVDGGLGSFLFACRQGLIERGSFLLVESLDRISRMVPRRAQRIVEEIVEAGVTVVTLNDGQEYTLDRLDNDPTAFILSYMVALRAHEESKTKGRRVAAAWEAKRSRVRAGSVERFTLRAPAWLVPDGPGGWKIDPVKGAVVRRVFAMTLAGAGEHMIARALNDDGVPSFGRGVQWHRSAISKLLRFQAVIGTMIPGRHDYTDGTKRRVEEAPIAGAFPAVIGEAQWLAVRALKDGSAASVRGRHAQAGVAHILAGLARCPIDGATMVRVNKGNPAKAGRPKLVCSRAKVGLGCLYHGVPVADVEGAIIQHWGEIFADIPSTGGDVLNVAHAQLESSIGGTEEHLEDLVEALDAAPSKAAGLRVAKVEAELRTMRADLDALDERRRLADGGLIRARAYDVAERFAALKDGGELDRNAVNAGLKTLFSGVVVDWQTGRLRFTWKQGGETELVYAWVDPPALVA